MNTHDYINKLNNILNDTSKFKQIYKDPTETLKSKINKQIRTLNAVNNNLGIKVIVGDYQPGYIYGTVKIHKQNNPLRPIISQIPTVTYNIAKTINKIISPYIPNNYTLSSTNDFVDLIQLKQSNGLLASLDVESLFTNVPINDTIKIIIEKVYSHETIPPPDMP